MATEKTGLIAVFDTRQFNQGLSDYLGGIKEANSATEKAEKSGFSLTRVLEVAIGNALVKVGELALDTAGKLAGLFVGAVEDAISLESAFAGVVKTTDGLTVATGVLNQEGEALLQGYRDLAKEVPISIEELMAIGEVGGQLGIQRENLLDFTETIAALGIATNLSSEEAAVGLAQFANVIGTSQDDIDNLGSAVVYLGNNFATTEKDVLNFGSRIVGAGKIAGLTEGDVLGIGAAFSSIGVGAEAGGTAVQKVLIGMNTAVAEGSSKVEDFASVSGMSASEFSAMWETDAAGAFALFVEGLGEAGDDASIILEDLELKDQRLLSAFLSLAQNSDLLKDSIKGANEAFEENTALSKESETRYATTESQIQMLKNNFRDFGFTIGGAVLPAINELIPGLIEFAERIGPPLAEAISTVTPLIEGLAAGFVALFGENPSGGIAEIGEVIGAVFGDEGQQAFLGFTEFLQVAIPEAIEFAQGIIQKFADFFATISPIVSVAVEQLKVIWQALKDNASIIWDGIKLVISGALDFVLGIITAWLGVVRGDWDVAWGGIKQAASGAWEFISGIIEMALGVILTIVGTNLEQLVTTIAQLWVIVSVITAQAWEAIKTFLSSAWETIKSLAEIAWGALKTTVTEAVEGAKTAVTDAFEAVKEYLNGIDLASIGSSIIQGLINGITSAGSGIVGALGGVVDNAIASAKAKLGIQSPSKVFEDIGINVQRGFAGGILEAGKLPQQAMASSISNLVSSPVTNSTTTIDNSRTANIEINNSGGAGTNNVFYDVVGALGAVGIA